MDAKTDELRAAHDVLAEFYADRLADALDHLPADRAMLNLFSDVTLAGGIGTNVPAGDGSPGDRCRVRDRVLGRPPRPRPGRISTGIPARAPVLKPPDGSYGPRQ